MEVVVPRALAIIVVVTTWASAAGADRLDRLAHIAEGDGSEKARIAAVVALGQLGDPRAEPALLHALDDASPIVRDVAASALRHLHDGHASTPAAAPETVPTRATMLPRETPRRVRVSVKHMSAPARQLSTRLHDLVVRELAADGEVTVDDVNVSFVIDGSVTRLTRGTPHGAWIEITCEVKLTISNGGGSLLSIVTGGATVQTARGEFRPQMEPALQAEALDHAVRGARENLVAFLVRQGGAR
jgi:hypothetical protein